MLAFSRSSISTHWWNALRFRSSCKTRDLYHLYRVLSPRQWFSTTDAKKDQGDKREEISGPNKSEDSTSYKVQDSWSLLLGSRTKIVCFAAVVQLYNLEPVIVSIADTSRYHLKKSMFLTIST